MNQAIAYEIELRRKRIQEMISYMRLKIDECDWHGVADAAMDLRDLESEILGITKADSIFEKTVLL